MTSRPKLKLAETGTDRYPASDVLERVGPGVAAAFLQKPYQAGMLAAKVDEVLRKLPGG